MRADSESPPAPCLRLKQVSFLRLPPRTLLVAAVTLDVAGGLLIVFSLPAGGPALWLGVALIAVGSLALRHSLGRRNAERQREPETPAAAAAGEGGIEAELQKPAPRAVQRTARGNLAAIVWIAAVLLAGAAAYRHFNLLPAPPVKSMLAAEGESAAASVHRKETREAENGATFYAIGYNFRSESGSVVRSSATVPRAVFDSLAEGERLEAVYFPPDPSLHYLPEITSPIPTGMVWLALGLLAAAAAFADAQRRVHKKLAAEGRAVAGFVADVRRRGGVRSFRVNYDFAGERRSIAATERNPGLANGQAATVLCDPRRPNRAVVYRLALYRAQ